METCFVLVACSGSLCESWCNHWGERLYCSPLRVATTHQALYQESGCSSEQKTVIFVELNQRRC